MFFSKNPHPSIASCWQTVLLKGVIAAVMLGAALASGAHAQQQGGRDSALRFSGSSPSSSHQNDGKVHLSEKGPWGQFEYFEAMLEAPSTILKATEPTSLRTEWIFPKTSVKEVRDFFDDLKLPPAIESYFSEEKNWSVNDGATVIEISRSVLEVLPLKARQTIYDRLGRSTLNPYHVEPEVVFADTVRQWLEGYGFDDALIRFVEATTYPRGNCLVFADTPAALSLCRSDAERIVFRQALSRTPTLVLKLLLNSGPIPDIADYWGRGTRFKSTLPFLASMARVPGADKIDIIHLLPAGVRKILYTFPNPMLVRGGYMPDCHWSSLNFFNPEPLERLADPTQATEYTLENFEVVKPPYQSGDVLFFTDSKNGNAYHSCAYVADDIVFTKNGRSPLQPWVLMKLDQVKAIYDLYYETNTVAYRRKQQS